MVKNPEIRKDTRSKSVLSGILYFMAFLIIGSVILLGLIQILQEQNQIYELNSKNLSLQAEIKVLDDQIKEMQVLISMHTSLEAVAERAKNEFGMIYPSGNQVLALRPNTYYSLDQKNESHTRIAQAVHISQKPKKEQNSDQDE